MTESAAPLPPIPDRRYERPPIVEALCELYFTGSTWDATTPGLFYERVRADYPNKSQVALPGVGLQIDMGGQSETSPFPSPEPCMRFGRADNSRLLQLAHDLLVINQLLPYSHFEEWREVVLGTLAVYRELAKPAGVARLGVRYINRINIPGPRISMEDYFRVYPHLPEEFGGSHGPFLLQLQLLPVCRPHQLALTLGMSPPEQPGTLSFLLDLYDMVRPGDQDTFEEIGRLLDEAHANIVHTFENAITDTARKLFGEIAHE